MGIFSFLKDAGEKLFGSNDKERAESISKEIASKNLDIHNLQVKVDSHNVTLLGHADTAKDAEIAVLVAGNFKYIASVEASQLTVSPPVQPLVGATAQDIPVSKTPVQMQTVVVKSGDTLSKIAAKHMGAASKHHELFEANRPMLMDPNKIYPGQTLRIPMLMASTKSKDNETSV